MVYSKGLMTWVIWGCPKTGVCQEITLKKTINSWSLPSPAAPPESCHLSWLNIADLMEKIWGTTQGKSTGDHDSYHHILGVLWLLWCGPQLGKAATRILPQGTSCPLQKKSITCWFIPVCMWNHNPISKYDKWGWSSDHTVTGWTIAHDSNECSPPGIISLLWDQMGLWDQ